MAQTMTLEGLRDGLDERYAEAQEAARKIGHRIAVLTDASVPVTVDDIAELARRQAARAQWARLRWGAYQGITLGRALEYVRSEVEDMAGSEPEGLMTDGLIAAGWAGTQSVVSRARQFLAPFEVTV
jgi:hypothetical protein